MLRSYKKPSTSSKSFPSSRLGPRQCLAKWLCHSRRSSSSADRFFLGKVHRMKRSSLFALASLLLIALSLWRTRMWSSRLFNISEARRLKIPYETPSALSSQPFRRSHLFKALQRWGNLCNASYLVQVRSLERNDSSEKKRQLPIPFSVIASKENVSRFPDQSSLRRSSQTSTQ
jgi:hypothetical protein